MNSRIKTVLFDFDGTLVESYPGIASSIRTVTAAIGIESPTDDQVKSIIGPGLMKSLRALYPEKGEEFYLDAQARFRSEYDTRGLLETFLYPGIEELVRTLHGAGVSLGIVTNKDYQATIRILENLKLKDLFAAVISNSMGHNKTDAIKEAILLLDADPASCVYVGDTETDLFSAQGAGIEAIAVEYGYGTRRDFEKYHPVTIVADSASLSILLLERSGYI